MRLGIVLRDLEPVHVALAALGAHRPCQSFTGHRLTDQCEPAPPRLGEQRQQPRRVGGDRDILALERDEEDVLLASAAKVRPADEPAPVWAYDQVEFPIRVVLHEHDQPPAQ